MMNIKMAAIVAIVWVAAAGNAFALTLKSGEVLTSDGTVAKASETKTGQNKLAQDGVLVAGGVVYIDLNGTTIEVPLSEIRGKSKEGIIAVIGEAAVEQMQDLHDAAQVHVDEIIADGTLDGAVNAVGKSAAEIVEEALASGAVEGAIVGVSEAAHQQILKEFEKHDGQAVIHPNQVGNEPY